MAGLERLVSRLVQFLDQRPCACLQQLICAREPIVESNYQTLRTRVVLSQVLRRLDITVDECRDGVPLKLTQLTSKHSAC